MTRSANSSAPSRCSQAASEDAPPSLLLPSGHIDIWLCSLDTVDAGTKAYCLGLLSRREFERYRSYSAANAREQYLIGRALTRVALSSYANIPEHRWRFSNNAYGRPAIAGPRHLRNIHFSLSHSSDLVALAVSRLPEIGIDVEAVDRQVDIHGIAALVFAPCEAKTMAHSAPDEERDRFFELWTLKEAYIKARGTGLSLPPETFQLADIDGRISLRCSSDCDPNPERWQFRLYSPGAGYKLALAIGSRAAQQIRWVECGSFPNKMFDLVDQNPGFGPTT